MIALIAKAGGLAAVGAVCALALRRYVPELSLLLGVVAGAAVLFLVAAAAGGVWEGLRELEAQAGLDSALTGPVYRVLIIAIITRLMSQICRDAGEGTVAVCCELAGTLGALAAALPLLRQVLALIEGLVE